MHLRIQPIQYHLRRFEHRTCLVLCLHPLTLRHRVSHDSRPRLHKQGVVLKEYVGSESTYYAVFCEAEFFLGRPPFAPLARAAADLAGDVAAPPRRAISRIHA